MREIWTRKDVTERSRLFLAASVGELSVTEACQKLGITRQRFYELEDRAVAGFFTPVFFGVASRPLDSSHCVPAEPLVCSRSERL